ncbi:MAG TPA: radical SAM protein, partial [bacterium]|nr:radical SAM protein [bacterium]
MSLSLKERYLTLKEADLKIINNYIKNLDYAVTGEFEAVLEKLLNHFKSSEEIAGTNGIMYKKDNKWILPDKPALIENLDSIPFPARDLMNNKLYVRPDNNRPMATIESAKGCPANCVYCLTPVISGKKVRFRSPENIIEELKECVRKYGIYDFFFRADTFTINKEWVIKLCSLILKEQMEISWIANSRVKPLDLETVEIMKKAGCRLIALGIESASNYTLSRLKKGITADEIINAVSIIKKCGVECYGFFMIGFPWEKRDDILKTINFAI